jgi:hypothetical protein
MGESNIHVAEMAHVFSASDEGPRADIRLSEAERGAYENLILLCPTCHAKIDKAEREFPDSLILKWKQQHKNKIQELFGVVEEITHSAESERDQRRFGRTLLLCAFLLVSS